MEASAKFIETNDDLKPFSTKQWWENWGMSRRQMHEDNWPTALWMEAGEKGG